MLHLVTQFMPIEILLQTILRQYLNDSYCLTVVSEKPLDFSVNVSFTYIAVKDGVVLFEELLEVSDNGCSDYVVQIEQPKKFMDAFEMVTHKGNVRRGDKKIVILPYREDNETVTLMLDLLSLKETSFVANILLILPSLTRQNCGYYDLVTHKYVGPENEMSEPYFLNRWNTCDLQFENNATLFPHDMKNLQGKIVRVACFTYTPYVLLDLDTKQEPLGRHGTEIKIVDEFCRWINCTIEIVRDDVHLWGEIYENQTGVGVIGNVVEDRADLGITALYSWYEEYLVLDFSAPGVRTSVTCIAPSPRLLASWEEPLLPFSWYLWLALIFTFVYASIAFTIAKGCSADKVLLTTFGIMIAQSQHDVGVSWRVRTVTGWMLLAGLVLGNAYGGGLASVFTVPKYERSIDSVQDIVERKMEWGATHDAWVFSLTPSTEPLIKKLVSQFKVYPVEVLKKKSMDRSMAFSIERLPSGYYAIGDYITKEAMLDLTVMQEDFYFEQCVVMMRKSSPYTNKISQLIGRLHESGLLLAWETQMALKYLNYEVQLAVRLSRSQKDINTMALGLRHVEGVFILYIIGVVLSVIIFIVETTYNRKRNTSF
uniref:Ionotropic receptor n=1 Tax=Glyphodes pyloalis TaxID=1242752 RepID=A0A6M3GU41_GLYPY|nr:ionotropic receptor [Glyphodes pyloalis]